MALQAQCRPPFKPVRPNSTAYTTPEELFYKLSGRQSTHGYLRGPQQDVLREYADKRVNTSDVAFELPAGTGKMFSAELRHAGLDLTGLRKVLLSTPLKK